MSQNYFTNTPPRRGTDSLKWDVFAQDQLPFWVADMEFLPPPAVQKALQDRLDKGVLGYGWVTEDFKKMCATYLERRYNWAVSHRVFMFLPGVMTGAHLATRVLSKENQKVVMMTPLYHPLLELPEIENLRLETMGFIKGQKRYEPDFEELKNIFEKGEVGLFILCNPHNPTGRVFELQELQKIEELCRHYSVPVISDEIHCDLVLDDRAKHIPFASISHWASQNTVTLMSPSKTYNIPGLNCAFAVVENTELRHAMIEKARGIMPFNNILGMWACKAALTDSEDWRQALLVHLRSNRERMKEFTKEHEAQIHYFAGEATYLAWLDLSKWEQDSPASRLRAHGLALSEGKDFGKAGFARFNFGCSKAMLEEGLKRFSKALK